MPSRNSALSPTKTGFFFAQLWKNLPFQDETIWQKYFYVYCVSWQYGLWRFQTGCTKLERFLPKNQHTQRKFLNFENWVNGKVSKSAKSPNVLTFKVNFLYQKSSESFSFFFFIEEYQSRSTFFVIDIFWQHQFLNHFTY